MRSLLVLLLLTTPLLAQRPEPFALKPNDTVLFLGDSNTFAGGFIAHIDATLRVRLPNDRFTLVNLGLPSETCTGLTEKDHPFPRPDVHDRVDRALAEIKPTVVVICYGMNDGIYAPFAEERFQAYQAGIRKLLAKVRAASARPILLTPPPFDPVPLKDKVRPATAGDFSYRAPFAEYDGVLRKYADWLLTLRAPDLPVVDVHAAVTTVLKERRKAQPNFTFCGDGIHPNAAGHVLIAKAILDGWKLPPVPAIDLAPGKPVEVTVAPFVPCVLRAVPPPGNSCDVYVDGVRLDSVTVADLAAGYDLNAQPKFPLAERGRSLLSTVQKQHAVLDLALLTAIGHKRPQTPKGIDLAEARKQAADFDKALTTLPHARTFLVELRPTKP